MMIFKATVALLAIALVGVSAIAKPKAPASCVVYFSVAEHDEITVGLTMNWLNKPQSSWYNKHGDRDKFAGICYAAKASDAPEGAPLYLVVWGEHLESRPYTYTYQTTETETGTVNGTVTDNEGNTANVYGTTSTDVPVRHTVSGESRFYVADGWLAAWDRTAKEGKGDFVPVAPLHNHNVTKFTSASASLLKDAMEQIRNREGAKLDR